MAEEKASATIRRFVAETSETLDAVFRQSTQELIADIQTPVAKGGRMRVDTGFLRASGQASLTGMPTGPVRPPENAKPGQYSDGAEVPTLTIVTIAKAKAGDTIFFGWTANYAIYREAKDAFLRLGVQKWQQIVDRVTRRLEPRG